jgi:hypothetical protein
MKNKFLFTVVLITGLLLVNFSVYQVYGQTPQSKVVKKDTLKYTCPVHHEITKANPGKCPKCGMTLVAKKDRTKGNMHHDSTMMKHNHKMMMHDSTIMKPGHKKTMHDSVTMKKGNMM